MHLKLERAMVTLLKEIYPEYYEYVTNTDKFGRNFMYAESKKAIYGTLEASLLFWGGLSNIL